MLWTIFLMLSLSEAFVSDKRGVAIIYRHGHRYPIGTYPNDPFKNETWPGGFGAMTLQGLRALFDQGKNLRVHYNVLVRDQWYSAENIYIRSSFFERSIMSAQSFAAGFLPAPSLTFPYPWQPAAVTALSRNEDNMILSSAPCPMHSKQYNTLIVFPPEEIQSFLKSKPNFLSSLARESGSPINTMIDFLVLYNIVMVQKENDLMIPVWAENMLVEGKKLYSLVFNIWTQTDYMKKAQFGGLITDIVTNFNAIIDGTDTRTIYQYSGSDVTILGLARILDVQSQLPGMPGYGATFALELEYWNGGYHIVAQYWKNTETLQPQQLNFPNCPYPCSVSNFTSIYNYYLDVTPQNFQTLCAITQPAENKAVVFSNNLGLIYILGILNEFIRKFF